MPPLTASRSMQSGSATITSLSAHLFPPLTSHNLRIASSIAAGHDPSTARLYADKVAEKYGSSCRSGVATIEWLAEQSEATEAVLLAAEEHRTKGARKKVGRWLRGIREEGERERKELGRERVSFEMRKKETVAHVEKQVFTQLREETKLVTYIADWKSEEPQKKRDEREKKRDVSGRRDRERDVSRQRYHERDVSSRRDHRDRERQSSSSRKIMYPDIWHASANEREKTGSRYVDRWEPYDTRRRK